MLEFILKRVEIVLIVFGIIFCAVSVSSLKQALDGLPNIASVEELKQYEGKEVVIISPIEHTGYTLENRVNRDEELYFYLGSISGKPIFLASDNYLPSETSSTTIIGRVATNYTGDNYEKLINAVCSDLKIDAEAFDSQFTPYIFNVSTVGEDAHSENMKNITGSLFFAVCLIIAGIIIWIRKKTKKNLDKNNI